MSDEWAFFDKLRMSGLIDQAKLTDEERVNLPDFDHNHNWTECDACEQYVADAATAKALWACVEWLRIGLEMYFPQHNREQEITHAGASNLLNILVNELQRAGIERPKDSIRCSRCQSVVAYVYTSDALCERCHNDAEREVPHES